MHFHVDEVKEYTGFAVSNAQPSEHAVILVSGVLTSDNPDFYGYVEKISNIFFNQPNYRIIPNEVVRFLVIIHKDLSADVYVNDFPFEIKIRLKRSVETGMLVTDDDIADISELQFSNMKIKESDRLIFCFKSGWKFGLYFNLLREGIGDIPLMQRTLGGLYRYLDFQYIYRTLESKDYFSKMLKDGWFPFVEILGSDYRSLTQIYENNKFAYEERVARVLDKFDEERIERFTEKWWTHPTFSEKKQLLEAGIDAFLQGEDNGYIHCINTLYPQIEGIVRVQYFKETAIGSVKLKGLIDHLIDKGKHSAGDDNSLLFPLKFLDYLNNFIFANFDLGSAPVDLSRHSAAHGVAVGKDYTRERALQAILTLDQICFYLTPSPNAPQNRT